jgi:hypothetical protein
MAITRDDFTQIPSTGIIPDDMVPADAFAVSFTFSYSGYPSLETFNHTFTGKLVVHVLNADDTIKYVITIEETYNLFIIPLAPGLAIFTWNWVPSSEKISGTKGDGPDAEPMAQLGEGASFGVDPAEGTGNTNGEVIVDSTFYSGIFQEPLEPGDKLKIEFHNLSAGFVVARASLRLATEAGTRRLLDTTFDAFGALLYARGVNGDPVIESGRSWPGHHFREPGTSLEGRDPTILELPDGIEIKALMTPEGYVEYQSLNSEWTWTRVQYPDKEKGFGKKTDIVWPPGVTMPQMIVLDDTTGKTRLTLAKSGEELLCRRIDSAGITATVKIVRAKAKQTYSLSMDGKGTVFVTDLSGLPVATSHNGGSTWKEVDAVATV